MLILETESAFTLLLTRSAVLVIPAGIAVAWWKLWGVHDRAFFKASCVNTAGYAVWLAVIALMSFGEGHPAVEWLMNSGIGAIAAFTPLLAVLYSLVLSASAARSSQADRAWIATTNILMFFAWALSVPTLNS